MYKTPKFILEWHHNFQGSTLFLKTFEQKLYDLTPVGVLFCNLAELTH